MFIKIHMDFKMLDTLNVDIFTYGLKDRQYMCQNVKALFLYQLKHEIGIE